MLYSIPALACVTQIHLYSPQSLTAIGQRRFVKQDAAYTNFLSDIPNSFNRVITRHRSFCTRLPVMNPVFTLQFVRILGQ